MTTSARIILSTIFLTLACALAVTYAMAFYAGVESQSGVAQVNVVWKTRRVSRLTRETLPAEIKAADEGANQHFLSPDFGRCEMLLLGCNEMPESHRATIEHILAAAVEEVSVVALVNNENQKTHIEELIRSRNLPADRIKILRRSLHSMWIRDYGPSFVHQRDNGRAVVADADYSAIADKERWLDDEFPIVLSRILGVERVSVPLRLEGGNLLTNGDGLCVTTGVLIDRNKSRSYALEDIGALLREFFGFNQWIYLEPLDNEPSGHVDMFVTILAEDLVLVGEISPYADFVNAERLNEWAQILSETTTSRGNKLRVERIPVPPRSGENWRSYNNVIILNRTILVPTFSDVDPALQQQALSTYERLMPGWKIIEIPADSLVPYRGLLRCISLQVPWYVPIESLLQSNQTIHSATTSLSE